MDETKPPVCSGGLKEDFFFRLLVFLSLVLGVVLRLYGATGDLWLDEIWNIERAVDASSFWAAMFFRHDNNHPLISAYAYLIGGGAPYWVYRIPSLLAGIFSLVLAYRYRLLWGIRAGQVLVVLISLSYLMILYSGEARGYSILVCGMLGAHWSLEHARQSYSLRGAFVFFFWYCMGFFAHFSMLLYLAPALIWFLHTLTVRESVPRALRLVGLYSLFPCVLSCFVYWYHLRMLPPGTGNLYSYADILFSLPLSAWGLPTLSPSRPDLGVGLLLCSLVAAVCILKGMYRLFRKGDSRWSFFLLLLLGVPCVVTTLYQPRVFCVRYLLVVVLGLYLFFAYGAGMSGTEGSATRAVRGLLLVFLLAHAGTLIYFVRDGRGKPLKLLETMASKDRATTFSSSQDFRAEMLLTFAKRRNPELRLSYVRRGEIKISSPDWFVLTSVDPFFSPAPVLPLQGARYRLRHVFPFVAESGWHSALYRREDSGFLTTGAQTP